MDVVLSLLVLSVLLCVLLGVFSTMHCIISAALRIVFDCEPESRGGALVVSVVPGEPFEFEPDLPEISVTASHPAQPASPRPMPDGMRAVLRLLEEQRQRDRAE